MSILAIVAVLAVRAASSAAQPFELTQPLAELSFDSGSPRLGSYDREQLRAVVAWANEHPWRLLVIQGYADRVGGRASNLSLSADRADAVRSRLLELGIEPGRLVMAAYGEQGADAARRVGVRGTLQDFRELVESQHLPRLPAPRPAQPPTQPPPSAGQPQTQPPAAQPQTPRSPVTGSTTTQRGSAGAHHGSNQPVFPVSLPAPRARA